MTSVTDGISQPQLAATTDRKLIGIVSLGGMLEHYDFIIYALMAPYISRLFFPTEEITNSLLMTFAVFSIGYLSRPLGGLIFGHQGDRHGRKKPLSFTILLMASATFLIGLLPTYSQIGYWAPATLIMLRVLQGISFGGESGGALTYINESIQTRKGLMVALLESGMMSGVLLAQGIHAILIYILGQVDMAEYGWRIPFLFGGILGIVGYIIRKKCCETLAFKQLQGLQQTVKIPTKVLFTHFPVHIICGVLFLLIPSSLYTMFIVYLPSQLMILYPESSNFVFETSALTLVMILTSILFGYLFDRYDFAIMLKCSSGCNLLFGFPLVWLIFQYPQYTLVCLLLGGVLFGLTLATMIPLIPTLFPTNIRYSGVAFSYGLGVAVSGMIPLFATVLTSQLQKTWASGFLLLSTGIIGILLVFLYYRLNSK